MPILSNKLPNISPQRFVARVTDQPQISIIDFHCAPIRGRKMLMPIGLDRTTASKRASTAGEFTPVE